VIDVYQKGAIMEEPVLEKNNNEKGIIIKNNTLHGVYI